jgi:hypothetical protein
MIAAVTGPKEAIAGQRERALAGARAGGLDQESSAELDSTDEPTPDDSSRDWRLDADKEGGLDTIEGLSGAGEAINQRLTAAYARMYLRDPETYKWPGMAAYASWLIGWAERVARKIQQEQEYISLARFFFGTTPGAGIQIAEALRRGNIFLFRRIHWQHLAYDTRGLKELMRISRTQELPITDAEVDAWRQIDAGRLARADRPDGATSSAADEFVWGGAERLLRYEQEMVLQPRVYDYDRDVWKEFSRVAFSPIPGDAHEFIDLSPDGTLSDFDQRWDWVSNSMLPAWRNLDANDRRTVVVHMELLAQGDTLFGLLVTKLPVIRRFF